MKALATKFLAHYSIWLAIAVMVIMTWLLFDAASNEIASSRLANHSQDVLQTISEIGEGVSRADSAQRGYLLSPSEAFLSEREQALKEVNESAARARKLTVDNPVQQGRIQQLESLLSMRIAIMPENAGLRTNEGFGAARTVAAASAGQRASARIFDVIAQLKQEELRLLQSRRAEVERRHASQRHIFIVAVLLVVLVLIAGYLGFVQLARSREKTEQKLRVMADGLAGAMYQLRHPPQGKPSFTFMSTGWNNVRGTLAGRASRTLPDWDSLADSIDERDRPQFVTALAHAMKSLEAFYHDYRITRCDGTTRWLHHEASMKKEGDGTILVNGYITDITKQRQLEAALHDAKEAADSANRGKSTFLATMSHEIRTPMNGLLGMLELLSLTKLNAEQRTTLRIVRESSRSLLRIIDDILDFSKIEAGKLEVRHEPASIHDIIENVHNIYSGNASSKGVLITRSADPQISPAVLVDAVRLRQILNNFVSNALKFTSRGSIAIWAELIERTNGEDRIRFTVKDTGIGISTENQQLLFQPFKQGDGDAERHAGGTGLGLTISRRLAQAMGGTVEMQSELGQGTTIVLMLSLRIANVEDLPKKVSVSERNFLSTTTRMRRMAPSVAKAQAEGTLVLLVDDHPTNRTLLSRQVRALGYAAESAADGVEALEKWKSRRFGMVITDCNMPGMGGYELARNIRRIEAASGGKRTPIVACTANALIGDAELCFAAGMDDCLVKPVELSQILKKLNQWLPIPRKGAAHQGKRAQTATSIVPVDRAVLAEMSGGETAAERDILRDFRRVNDEDVGMLKWAVATRDIPQITRTTHRILGASRMIGALGLANLCEPIDLASRASNWKAVAASMETFHQQWTCLNTYFDSI